MKNKNPFILALITLLVSTIAYVFSLIYVVDYLVKEHDRQIKYIIRKLDVKE